jgi:hypothetical protein
MDQRMRLKEQRIYQKKHQMTNLKKISDHLLPG